MKYVLLFFVLLIFSCAMPGDKEFVFDKPIFKTMQEANEWVYKNISYKDDFYDKWKIPQQTLDDGCGDCEDMAILLMGIMNYQQGINSQLLIVEKSFGIYHAILQYDGNYYEPTSGTVDSRLKYKIVATYDYYGALFMAKYIKTY
jgi:hypothetical protein